MGAITRTPIGKMKNETGGVVIKELVGLKPKMYSFLVDNGEHTKAKGANKKAFLSSILFNFQSNQDSFFGKHIVRLLAWHIKFEKRKEL